VQVETLPQLACVCASLRRASRSVTRLYERALGVSVPRFTLLYVLNKQPLNQSMVAELLAVDRTTLTRTLGAMERSGLIRSRTNDDKRERVWSLTTGGKQEFARVSPRWERAQDRLRKRLGADRWELLINELTIIAAAARMRLSDGVDRFRVRKTATPRL
jgi:DNA-binding MarR family transcriptional regulator